MRRGRGRGEPRSDRKPPPQYSTGKSGKSTDRKKCRFCAKEHVMNKEKCPAYGKRCTACNGWNHFHIVCKKAKGGVHAVNETDEEYEYVDCITVGAVQGDCPRQVYALMEVKGRSIKLQVDTGATVNLIPKSQVGNVKIEPHTKTLRMWNKTEKKPLGECRLRVVNPRTGDKYKVRFTVVDGDYTPLLGINACERMGLVSVNDDSFHRVAVVKSEAEITESYAEVFGKDLGILPGEVHLKVDATVMPEISASRRVPVALKPTLKIELEKMAEQGVIEPVDEPTDWVSSMVVAVKKSGDLRMCIDLCPLNRALKREHYQLPTLEDVLPKLSRARTFTVANLKSGYWHVKLDEPSSLLTTFNTPFGRYKWKRLPFGISVASEIFQKNLQQCVGDIEGNTLHC
jgi:hypothetical protein